MGLDAGFRTKDGRELIYFRKFGELDDFIVNHCKITGDPVYDADGDLIPNDSFEFRVKLASLEPLRILTKSIYNILAKYSNKVIDELSDGIKPKGVNPRDISQLEDCLYTVPEFRTFNSAYFFSKCIKLFYFLAFLYESEIQEDLIYWRSY